MDLTQEQIGKIKKLSTSKKQSVISDMLGIPLYIIQRTIKAQREEIGIKYGNLHLRKTKVYHGSKYPRKLRPAEAFEAYGVLTRFDDLKPHQCSFGVEGTDLFCGADKKKGSAYCEKHHAICYKGFPNDKL